MSRSKIKPSYNPPMGNDLNAAKLKVDARIQQKIDDTAGDQLYFSLDRLDLTKLSAEEARRIILENKGELSLPELFQMYHFAKQLERNSHNAMTDVFYLEPLKEAYKFQRLIDKDDNEALEKLPLVGYVLSIKEYLAIKGTDSTWGYFLNYDKPVDWTADMITFLKSKGAIIGAKGNVPQLLMAMESNNDVFGDSKNPYDPTRTSGGSSGGEGALIALNLVNAGIGSDIGGSIRIPSLFCGIWGFKPTAGRLDYNASASLFHDHPFDGRSGEDQHIIKVTYGPMARSAYDLTALMKVLVEHSLSTWTNPPLPWRSVETPKRVGFVPEMTEYYRLPECCSRVFNEAKDLLSNNNIELVEINIGHLIYDLAINTYAAFFKDQGLQDIFNDKTPLVEPYIESYNELVGFMSLPTSTLKSLSNSSLMSLHSKLMIDAMLKSRSVNTSVLLKEKVKLMDLVMGEFKRQGVEVALAYGLFPAPKLNNTESITYALFYTCLWNYLNFPAGTVPMGKVKENEQYYHGRIGDKVDIAMEEMMEDSKGLPIGIQVVGLQYHDEEVMKLMETMQDLLSKRA